MAKPNRIQFTDGQFAYDPTYNFQDVAGSAPANATPPKQVTTGQEQKTDVTAGPIGQATQRLASQKLQDQMLGNFAQHKVNTSNPLDPENYKYTGQYGASWSPEVYNRDALEKYDQGLQAARAWDAQSSLSPGFKERIYNILNGGRPEAQLTAYVPNAAMQYQTSNPGDGSVMQNPNTNPELALQWNVDQLRKLHPDWTDAQLQQYMSQPFNWQAAQGLTNAGVWEPNQASRDWTAYQAEQARLAELARRQAAAAAAQPSSSDYYDYQDSGYQDGGYQDSTGDYENSDSGVNPYAYTQSESDARRASKNYGVPIDYRVLDYTNPEYHTPPKKFAWLDSLLGS